MMLDLQARTILADAGITVRDWIAYGGWLKEDTDEDGNHRWVPETEWRGDECGCSDDRCIGYHHDKGEECGCLPALIENRARVREAYDIWQAYRRAVESNGCRGRRDAYAAVWSRAGIWVRRHSPRALTFSLEAVVKGERGISATYAGTDPGYVGSEPVDEGHYRQRLWTEGTDPNGYISHERSQT